MVHLAVSVYFLHAQEVKVPNFNPTSIPSINVEEFLLRIGFVWGLPAISNHLRDDVHTFTDFRLTVAKQSGRIKQTQYIVGNRRI